ncbi:uncharacterized protein METZ01_LOCUS211763, partial [marine metagenome]
ACPRPDRGAGIQGHFFKACPCPDCV